MELRAYGQASMPLGVCRAWSTGFKVRGFIVRLTASGYKSLVSGFQGQGRGGVYGSVVGLCAEDLA